MSYKDSGVMWRNIWLLLVDNIKLFYTVGAYKLIQKILCFWVGLSIGRIQAENHKTDKNRNNLIWTQFRSNTSSICLGGGRTGGG
jgi:hypothetical protein